MAEMSLKRLAYPTGEVIPDDDLQGYLIHTHNSLVCAKRCVEDYLPGGRWAHMPYAEKHLATYQSALEVRQAWWDQFTGGMAPREYIKTREQREAMWAEFCTHNL
jgi:hypothetical protein